MTHIFPFSNISFTELVVQSKYVGIENDMTVNNDKGGKNIIDNYWIDQ